MKKEKLQAIAEEFNELFGLDPEINAKGKTTKVIADIKEAAEMIEPEDEITKETIAGLKELGIPMGKKEEDDIPEEIDLVKEIEKADRVQDLRDIARAYEEFKSLRGMLTKWKTVMSLKDVMLNVLEDKSAVVEVKAEMKIVEKKPVKKEKPNKEKVKEEKIEKKEDKLQKKKIEKTERPGVIKTIISCIENANKKGISKEEILKRLKVSFPERKEESMKKTINVQVPNRITKEHFEVKKTKDGKFYKGE